MSQYLNISRVSRIAEELPAVIKGETDYVCASADRAKEWEKEIGQQRQAEYEAIDYREAAKELFGETSASWRNSMEFYTDPDSWLAETTFFLSDGRVERVHKRDVLRFNKTYRYDAYIYAREELMTLESGYLFHADGIVDRPVTRATLLKLAEEFAEEYGAEYDNSYYAAPLFQLMIAYFKAKDEDEIVIQYD